MTGRDSVNGARTGRPVRQTGRRPESRMRRRRDHRIVILSTIHVDNSVGTRGSASYVLKETKPFFVLPNI